MGMRVFSDKCDKFFIFLFDVQYLILIFNILYGWLLRIVILSL